MKSNMLRYGRGVQTVGSMVGCGVEPCEEINFTKIAIRFSNQLNKDTIFKCFRRILTALGEALTVQACVSVSLGVGVLRSTERRLEFDFDRMFTKQQHKSHMPAQQAVPRIPMSSDLTQGQPQPTSGAALPKLPPSFPGGLGRHLSKDHAGLVNTTKVKQMFMGAGGIQRSVSAAAAEDKKGLGPTKLSGLVAGLSKAAQQPVGVRAISAEGTDRCRFGNRYMGSLNSQNRDTISGGERDNPALTLDTGEVGAHSLSHNRSMGLVTSQDRDTVSLGERETHQAPAPDMGEVGAHCKSHIRPRVTNATEGTCTSGDGHQGIPSSPTPIPCHSDGISAGNVPGGHVLGKPISFAARTSTSIAPSRPPSEGGLGKQSAPPTASHHPKALSSRDSTKNDPVGYVSAASTSRAFSAASATRGGLPALKSGGISKLSFSSTSRPQTAAQSSHKGDVKNNCTANAGQTDPMGIVRAASTSVALSAASTPQEGLPELKARGMPELSFCGTSRPQTAAQSSSKNCVVKNSCQSNAENVLPVCPVGSGAPTLPRLPHSSTSVDRISQLHLSATRPESGGVHSKKPPVTLEAPVLDSAGIVEGSVVSNALVLPRLSQRPASVDRVSQSHSQQRLTEQQNEQEIVTKDGKGVTIQRGEDQFPPMVRSSTEKEQSSKSKPSPSGMLSEARERKAREREVERQKDDEMETRRQALNEEARTMQEQRRQKQLEVQHFLKAQMMEGRERKQRENALTRSYVPPPTLAEDAEALKKFRHMKEVNWKEDLKEQMQQRALAKQEEHDLEVLEDYVRAKEAEHDMMVAYNRGRERQQDNQEVQDHQHSWRQLGEWRPPSSGVTGLSSPRASEITDFGDAYWIDYR
eukprot:gene13402-19253_t